MSRVLLLLLFCPSAWAEPTPRTVSPYHLAQGRSAEIRMQVPDGTDRQFVVMPGGPWIRQTIPLDHPVHDMAAHQGRGLLAAGERGLLVVEVAASGKMNISASHATHGKATRVVAEDDHAWLVNDGTEVVMLDIGDPARPVESGRYRAGQSITDIAVQGGYIYLLLGKSTVAVIDMRVPQTPVELSRFVLDGAAKRIFVSGDHIHVAQPGYGLEILDAGDKAHIRQIGRHAVTGGATVVTVQDDVALLARGEQGVTLLDVSDPAQVKWLGSHSRVGRVAGIAANGNNRTLLWNDRAELISLDLANPELPAIAASHPNVGAVSAIWLDDKTVLAATASALQSMDFSATTPLFSNENLDTGQGVNFGGERRLFIAGDIAYVADWFSGLHLYDIRTPARPHLLSSFHTPGSAKGVVVRDGIAYVADDDHGLQVVDVRDPLRPARLASLATSGLAYTPKLAGNLLYLAGHRGGFQVIDVSDAAVPRLFADISTPGKAWSLDIAGNTLFVADDAAGVLVFDVSDATHPRQIGVFDPGGAAEDVVVRGDTAYAAFFDKGFYVLDISDPARPRQVGHTPTSGNARGIALKGELAYVTDWFAGVQVIDVSDRSAPAIVGAYDTGGAAWGIAIKGEHAYIGDWWGGFAVLDIGDPARPVQVDRYQARGKVIHIAAQGRFAYAAMDSGSVQVFDITNPLNPTWITAVEIAGDITGLVQQGGLIHVAVGAGRDSGLVTIDASDPFQARRIRQRAVEGGVQRIGNAPGRLYFSNEYGLGVIDISDPDRTRSGFKLAKEINDLRVEGKHIFLATGQGLEVLDDQFRVKSRYRTAQAATMVRARGNRVFLYGPGLGMRVLDVSGARVRPVSSFDPAEKWSDMTVAGDMLYATGTAGNLLAMDAAEPARLRGIYPLTTPATGIKIVDGIALLAGNDIITSVKLLPAVVVTRRGRNEIRIRLPREMPAGTYDMAAIAPNGSRSISHDILSIDAPRLSRPDITPEEFQQLLQEQRKKTGQSVPAR